MVIWPQALVANSACSNKNKPKSFSVRNFFTMWMRYYANDFMKIQGILFLTLFFNTAKTKSKKIIIFFMNLFHSIPFQLFGDNIHAPVHEFLGQGSQEFHFHQRCILPEK
jgi:hypothetical protein